MRQPEQQLRAALGDPNFELDAGSIRRQGKWFTHYEMELPRAFQHGIPPLWRFSLLTRGSDPISVAEKNQIVLEAMDTIDGYPASEESDPLVFLCDEPQLRLNDELPHKHPKVFFLDHSDFAGRARTVEPPRSAPFLLAIRRELNTQQSTRLLSPYVPNRPASSWRFFGRQKEVSRILHSSENIIVVGARRIGKTSLLQHLSQTLRDRKIDAYYINVQDCSTESEVVNRILNLLPARHHFSLTRQRQSFPDRGAYADRIFYLTLNRLSGKGGVVLLIDELGNVISKNQKDDWKIIGVLRTFAQTKKLRVIASAFQELIVRQQKDFEGPWVNFFSTVRLSGMSKNELRDFVIAPLANWVNINNPEALIELVVTAVGQHPLILQYFCQAMFTTILQNQELDVMDIARKIVDTELVHHFSEAIEDIFYNVPPVMKYVYLLACHDASLRSKPLHEIIIDDDHISEALRRAGFACGTMGRRNLLQGLEIRGLTQAEDDNLNRQRVITPILHRAIKRIEVDVERYIDKLRSDIVREAPVYDLRPTGT